MKCKKKLKAEKMWAIVSDNKNIGIYSGTWTTRKSAIYYHCKDVGKSWEQCKKDGDRAIKVLVVPI